MVNSSFRPTAAFRKERLYALAAPSEHERMLHRLMATGLEGAATFIVTQPITAMQVVTMILSIG